MGNEGEKASQRPAFPVHAHQPDDDEEWTFVPLCSVPTDEADAICARLEREGLPSEIKSDTEIATILVRDEDLETARAVLANPSQAEGDDPEFEKWRMTRDVSNWVCPKCQRQTLEQLPLSQGWRQARIGCLGLVLLPVVCGLVSWLFSSRALDDFFDQQAEKWRWIWLIVVTALACATIVLDRGKYCPVCGWQSKQE